MKLTLAFVAALALASPVAAQTSDSAIKQRMIKESINNYSGNCPCPYNTASNGSRCGGRSAHSRAGGESPRCFASDISAAEVAAYRRANGLGGGSSKPKPQREDRPSAR